MFEPDASNVHLLRDTIAGNRLENIRLFPCAVSDTCGTIDFLIDEVSGKTGSIVNRTDTAGSLHSDYGLRKSSSVECRTLDSMPEWRGRCDVLMKIDVEGAEEKVLAGAIGVLREIRPIVIIECFDLSHLTSVVALRYRVIDLEEKGNYLLVPEEQTALLDKFGSARENP